MNIVIKDQDDYGKLFNIIFKEDQVEKIIIHLYKVFLNPSDILILTEFILVQLQIIGKADLIVHDPKVKQYLEAIGIFEFCSKNHAESTEIVEIPSYTAMPIRRVNTENMNYYIAKTESFFQNYCPNKDLGFLNIALSELVNNAYDHSKSKVDSLIFCQYYSETNEIKIAVSDLGLGIPNKVNKYLETKGAPPLSPNDAVNWALKLNNTTESMPHNAGRGLDTISSFVRANNGSWMLLTDQVKMTGIGAVNHFSQNPVEYFIGTVIEITIKVTNLEDREIIEDIDWNF